MAHTTAHDNFDVASPKAGQMPIVLARLPRVGEPAPTVSAPTVSRAAAPPAPHTTAPLPPPEHLPQLDLRTEIHQRMHIADLAHEGPSAPMGRYFQPETKPQPSEPSEQDHNSTRRTTITQRRDTTRHVQPKASAEPSRPAAGLSETVYQLHSQLAPYAGLIVTLALIASAGLLYWMIVGPTQSKLPALDMPIYQFEQGHLGSDEPLVPEFYLEPAESTPAATSTTSVREADISAVALPVPPVAAPQLTPQTQIESAHIQQLPATEASELQFPSTERPDPLDFTKMAPSNVGHQVPAVPVPQQLPAVARQPQGVQIR